MEPAGPTSDSFSSASLLSPVSPASPTSPASPASPASGSAADGHRPTEINALLGRGTRFEGKLVFEGRVRIDGGFTGEIHGDDVLVIGEGAHVKGEILVATCIVTGGEVEANIRARDGIELYAPARVTGALHAPAIFIDRGVRFEGTCKMAPLEPSEGLEVLDIVRARLPEPAIAEAPATPRAGTDPAAVPER